MIPLATFLDDTNNAHSEFQMDRFITIRSGGTLYGCYHQACREVSSRVSALADCLYSIETTSIKIELADRKASRTGDPLRRRLFEIRAGQLRFGLQQLRHRLEELRREFIRFYGQCVALYRALGFDTDRPTASRLAELEAERWEHNIRSQIAIELFTQGRPGRNTVEALQSMPPEMRKRIGEECLSSEAAQQRCIGWYFDYSPNVPEPMALSAAEQQELLECCESSLSPKRLPSSSPKDARPSPPKNIASDSKSAIPALGGSATPVHSAAVS